MAGIMSGLEGRDAMISYEEQRDRGLTVVS